MGPFSAPTGQKPTSITEQRKASFCSRRRKASTDSDGYECFGSVLWDFKSENEVERPLSHRQPYKRRKYVDGDDYDTDERLKYGGSANERIGASRSAATDLHLISSSISIHEKNGSCSGQYRRVSTDRDGYERFHSGASTDSRIHKPLVSDSECRNYEVARPRSHSEAYRRSTSFARVVHESYVDGGNDDISPELVELIGLTSQESRAWERMIILTDSELETLINNLNIFLAENMKDNKAAKVKALLEWRRWRGDFGTVVSCDDEVEQVLLNISDVQALPWDPQTWTKEMLLSFPRPDLQLECLLRVIRYDGEQTKMELVEKLLLCGSESSSMRSCNTFQILEEQSKADI
ncbi:hypothetical protein KP509_11G095300 [Ceratopteris richardii]|uniref:Uncharacterized protein n=1 Tax=Ceratopteris richardii TaxID=49495 RepID=A0A8T2TSD9_CERRI|nr:hypothetical protein KP509_11G095300 [Ceratopteris richardii]